MAVKDKAMFQVELDRHMMTFLEEMVQQYQIPDTSKALRILITYAIDSPDDLDSIFQDVRCLDCE